MNPQPHQIVKKIYKGFVIMLVSTLMWSCEHKEEFIVKDATKHEVFTLKSNIKKPSTVRISIDGILDGEAKVSISPWNSIKIKGSFSEDLHQDWFESDCDITYEPISAKSGSVKITCSLE